MSLTPRIDKIERELNAGRVKTSLIEAPNTQIKNEQGDARKITDLSNNLKASFGIERVDITGWTLLDKEFGPSGELVYGPLSDDERFRFVGPLTSTNSSSGVRHFLSASNFVEVTFYGTALNMLNGQPADGTRTIEYSVDGGASQTVNMSASNVLENRNYTTRCIFNVVSGLSLGIHTVRISLQSGSTPVYFSGFEIVNTTSQLAVNTGSPVIGTELSVQQLLDVKPAELTGTKGGRVVTYLNEDGTVGQAVTEVEEDVTGPELVTNGTFDTDISGWTDASVGTGTTGWSGGEFVATPQTGGNTAQAYQAISTTVGKLYKIQWQSSSNADNSYVFVTNAAVFAPPYLTQVFPSDNGTQVRTLYFTAEQTTSYIWLGINASNGGAVTYDNVSVQEVQSGGKYLTGTDHSQEEIVRRINFREFGANRGDDFSTLSTSTRDAYFTLDDGTTTLVGDNITAQSTGLQTESIGAFVTITFIGTGLDVVDNSQGGRETRITVDGVAINTGTTLLNNQGINKICSGLPYGTHTVKIERLGSSGNGHRINDFIIYQPKKPILPDTALQEISDYNVIADYVENFDNVAANTQGMNVSKGILRKMPTREWVFGGGSWGTVGDNTTDPCGIAFTNSTDGAYVEYTFFGTGFNFRFNPEAGHEILFFLNGSSDFSSLDTSYQGNGGATWTPATGKVVGNDGPNSFVAVKNLPLAIHTLRVALVNRVSGGFFPNCFDIITPIHINTNLKTGSLALKDLRNEDTIQDLNVNKIDLTKAKAWVVYDFSTQEIAASYNVAAVLQQTAQNAKLYFKQPFKHTPSALMMGNGVGGTLTYMIRGINGVGSPDRHGLDFRPDNVNNVTYVTVVCFGELENEEDIDLEDL